MTKQFFGCRGKIWVSIVFLVFTVSAYCQDEIKLESLDLSKISTAGVGWNRVGAGKNILGKPIVIAGHKFESGIGVMAHSTIYVKLDKSPGRFSAQVGVDDMADGNSIVKFRIFGDGKELYNSGPMKKGDAAKPIDVNVSSVDMLVLVALPRTENLRHGQCGDWADAKFSAVMVDKPEIIARPVEKAEILTPPSPSEPRINGPKIFGVRPNSPFLFTIPATGKRPMKFSVLNLPKGLEVNESTGVISGTLDSKGRHICTLVAANSLGKAQREFRIVVGDTLALTPPMGWNSWYVYLDKVDDAMMRTAADIMAGSGMIDHGYSYINIDDGWGVLPALDDPSVLKDIKEKNRGMQYHFMQMRLKPQSELASVPVLRDSSGMINANAKFPDMKALTSYIHSLGLKAGIYCSPGPLTCACSIGSYGHELLDARRFSDWGFDFLKYDWCSYGSIVDIETLEVMQKPYKLMADALSQQKRDMVYNLCQYGRQKVWAWPNDIKGNCWRTDNDLGAISGAYSLYCNFITVGFGQNGLEKYAGPGHWNDPDYIMIGYKATGPFMLSPNEQYTYMSLWSLLASPLIYSGDMTKLDEFLLNVLCNDEIIAVNQDPLGKQGSRIAWDDDGQIWAKDMEDGSKAVGLFNTTECDTIPSIKFAQLGLKGKQKARDLWRQKDLGTFEDSFKIKVPSHGAAMVLFSVNK